MKNLIMMGLIALACSLNLSHDLSALEKVKAGVEAVEEGIALEGGHLPVDPNADENAGDEGGDDEGDE